MQIKYFTNNNPELLRFVQNSEIGSVSQTSAWGELQKNVPSRGQFWAFGVINDDDQIVGSCVLIRHKLGKENCYLYAHRGPVLEIGNWIFGFDREVFDLIIGECERIAQKERAVFLRIDPMLEWEDFKEKGIENKNLKVENWRLKEGIVEDLKIDDIQNNDGDEENYLQRGRMVKIFCKFFQSLGFVPAHAQYQPLSTLQLDLTKSLDELRSEMKSMGKRNLKKAEKAELEVGWTHDPEGPEIYEFDKLNQITTERDDFYSHQIDYYQRILRKLGQYDMARLYYAKFEGQYLAMALTTFCGRESVYYYGASSNNLREKMAPWILQWRMIQDAKERGCTRYDFLGISPEGFQQEEGKWGVWLGSELKTFTSEQKMKKFCEKEHSFAKITFFKTRWGGQRRDFVGAWEKVYNKRKYRVLLFLKKVRRFLRKIGIRF